MPEASYRYAPVPSIKNIKTPPHGGSGVGRIVVPFTHPVRDLKENPSH
ncbi:MAG: hypothetical protein ACHQQQ_03595 [Bacteroidota bacterium]